MSSLPPQSQSEPSASGMSFENYELCSDLASGDLCFRVRKYVEGRYSELAHEHVPSFRLSQDRALEVARALVARFEEWPGKYIVHSHLNRRGRNPQTYPGFSHYTSHPEAGVLRQHVSSSHVTAWVDSVISKSSFRRSIAGQEVGDGGAV